MFQLINRKLHSGSISRHVSTKKIPTLFPSYSEQFNLNILGVYPANVTLQRIIVAPDDTQKHTTLGGNPLDL